MDSERFRKALRDRGLRFTKEREAILHEALVRRGHFDLEQFHMDLLKKGLRVSKASVYRTLPILLELGVLEQVERTDKHAHYERTTGRAHHDHMLCLSCGRVIEFYSAALEKLQEAVCRAEGFRGASHSLEIRGYCRRCAGRAGAGRGA
jgi:Fur family ferric uptake transcriptional regulator